MPKVVDHAARRAEILARCFDLFAEQGYAALTMRSIARALGVSTGSLYYYFESKEQIFAEMVRHSSAQNVALALAEIPADAATAAERLAGLARFVSRNADTLQKVIQIVVEYARQQEGPLDAALLQATLGVYRTAIADQLGLSSDPGEGAGVVLSLLLGALLQHHLDPASVDLERQVQAIAALLPAP